jgi:hypothetical protein
LLTGVLCLALLGTPIAALAETPTPSPATVGEVKATDSDGDGRPDQVDLPAATATARLSGVAVEDLSQRTERLRVMVNPDGSSEQEAHAAPMWIQGQDGKWKDVDYTLIPHEGGGFEPRASPSTLIVDGGGAKEFARLNLPGGGSTVWSWPVALPTPIVGAATATYAVSPGVDLLVTASAYGVSTRIRINTPEAVAPEFTVRVRTEGVDLSQTDEGQLFFTDGNKRAGQTSTLTAWDARLDKFGDPVESVPVEADLDMVSSSGDRTDQDLTLATPEELVSNPLVEFPITIDPDIAPLVPSQDTWVRKDTTSIENSYRLMAGRLDGSANTNPTISYLQWPNTAIAGKTITSARLYLFQYAAGSCAEKTMNIHPLGDTWSSTTAVYSNKPTAMTTTGTSSSMVSNRGGDGCSASTNGFVSADLTGIVQAWAKGASAGGYANRGIQLNVPSDKASDLSYERRFCSVDYDPTTSVCYDAGRTPYMTVTLPAVPLAFPGQPAVPTVVLTDAAPVETQQEAEPIAPETFAVDGDTIYLDDPVGYAIRKYVGSQFQASIDMTDTAVVDMQVSGTNLTVLDNDSTLNTFTLSGTNQATLVSTKQLVTTAPTSPDAVDPAHPDAMVNQIGAFDGGIVARFGDNTQVTTSQNVSSPGPVGVLPSIEHFEMQTHGFTVLNSDNRILKTISVPYDPQSIHALYRGGGYDYYTVCDAYTSTSDTAIFNGYVYKFTTGGAPAGVYTLASSDSPPPGRDVLVSGGQVYQLLIVDGSAEVLRLSPDTGSFVNAADLGRITDPATDLVMLPGGGGGTVYYAEGTSYPDSVPKPAGRDKTDTLFDASRMAHLTWTYTKSTNGNKPAGAGSNIRQPRYLAEYNNEKKYPNFTKKDVRGYPYTWGGFDGFTSSSNPDSWNNFAAAVAKGIYTGNTTSRSDNYVAGTAGLDCSGLVSSAFKLPGAKKGTTNLIDGVNFKAISGHTPKDGDIYVRVHHHVVIILDTQMNNGSKIYIVAESTTAGKSDRVMHWSRDPRDFQAGTGYRIGRYRNWS